VEKLEAMRHSLHENHTQVMCNVHIKKLGSAVNLITGRVKTNEIISRLAKVAKYSASRELWYDENIHSNSRAAWFRHGKKNLGTRSSIL
jgi:hypothetical protein